MPARKTPCRVVELEGRDIDVAVGLEFCSVVLRLGWTVQGSGYRTAGFRIGGRFEWRAGSDLNGGEPDGGVASAAVPMALEAASAITAPTATFILIFI